MLKRLSRLLSDKTFVKIKYRMKFKRKLNLKNPQSFNEKLQWLKLYNRKPEYCDLVDKYEVKKIVAEKIGEEHIIPTLGVWDKFEDIDFDKLPNQFVLKCTHDSGGLVICKDKSKLDLEEAKKKINASLKTNYFWQGREWPYKSIKPRIIAEKYMVDESGYELKDYKFLCFGGEPKLMYIVADRQTEKATTLDFFDMDFNHMPIKNGGNVNAEICPSKPSSFEEMKRLAAILSANIPHVRIDFYDINGQIYFGEITFFDGGGCDTYEPESWDYKMGEWITLPKKEK